MDKQIRVSLAQLNSTVGALAYNTEKIIDFIYRAQALSADVVVFPELAICGYPPEDLLFKRHFITDNLKALGEVTKKVDGIVAIVGFVDTDKEGALYNAAAIIQNKHIIGVYHKISLPNYGVFDEKRYFRPGARAAVFEIGKIRFGVNICEDIWDTPGAATLQVNLGLDLIINISASPYYMQKTVLRKKILAGRAKQMRAFICYDNLVGGQDELVFDGASMILNPEGKVVLFADQFKEDLFTADLQIKQRRKKPHFKKCSQLKVQKDLKKTPLVKRKQKRLDRLNEIYSALVLGTKDYILKNGFKKVVLGLSGGIDSALVAAIATDAIGRNNVTCISMPSQYTAAGTRSDAKLLANNLGVAFTEVPIGSIFAGYLKALSKIFAPGAAGVAHENLQARIRGNILMAFSNKFGWLLLNTGNKSETSVGYCTLYGDMAGGFAVIKDVPKTLVYELVTFINKQAPNGPIPKSIITRAPSAELKLNQKDQDTLPAYSTLDPILKEYIEKDKSPENIIKRYGGPAIVREVINMVDRNEYKRRQAPPGIKITPKAFGRDRRFPITNNYKEC